jgi:hypothetical protein
MKNIPLYTAIGLVGDFAGGPRGPRRRPFHCDRSLATEECFGQGNNGCTCMPDVPGRPQHNPMCVDETMMQWLNATRAGKKPNIDRVGLSYMLMGEARQGRRPRQGSRTSQRLVLYRPARHDGAPGHRPRGATRHQSGSLQ